MPYFFQENLAQDTFTLSPEESKHITKSLRLKEGDKICFTDGKGTLAKAVLTNVFKDTCTAEIEEREFYDSSSTKKIHLAVAPTKNPARMEWLVEKAVEVGVSKISFIICDRSERKHIDIKRLQRVAIAALKQSQGVWLPEIETLTFLQFVSAIKHLSADKFIAYCDEKEQTTAISDIKLLYKEAIFLIGPEGDFTPQEIASAKASGFLPISLGNNILRTETAALFVVCCCKGILK